MLLTLLLLAEGVTILSVRQLITAHIAIGLMLVAPVAVKIGTTTYRFARYYLGDGPYVHRGPPPLVLRMIGPLVVISTVALLGTGVALLFRRPGDAGFFLTLHKASFIVWIPLMALHFLGHVVEAGRLTARDLSGRRAARDAGTADRTVSSGGSRLRIVLVVLTLAAGVGTAAAATPGNHWSHSSPRYERHDGAGEGHLRR
ncbi:MAG TPA: hypothetical protein VLR26_04440 [Frankiaceae bacterium]|nr:hypothetical protein [Frankiaceae bacterium]